MKTNKTQYVPLAVSIHLRYLYQDKGVRGKALLKRYPMYSKATIYRHATKEIYKSNQSKRAQTTIKQRGRPSKLTDREKRSILRKIPVLRDTVGSFTTKRLREAASVTTNVCDETVRRFLHSAGYRYFHSRKKGLLTKEDLKKRTKFARRALNLPDQKQLWRYGISFYFDAAGFQHKYNPFDEAKSTRTMAWRKRDEGLDRNCTAKGSRVGSGGKVLHYMVAISYSKGVVLCEPYEGHINGIMFSKFIKDHFPAAFEKSVNPKGKLFLQDGDPSQNSKLAELACKAVGAKRFVIPARSPDMNPIENMFNFAKQCLHDEALKANIQFENVEQFAERVERTLKNIPVDYINKTIESMDKRMAMIVKAGGKRIKY